MSQKKSGLFKGTKGDLMYRANDDERAELQRLFAELKQAESGISFIDRQINAVYQKIKERVYGEK